jgi:hypothetical protein
MAAFCGEFSAKRHVTSDLQSAPSFLLSLLKVPECKRCEVTRFQMVLSALRGCRNNIIGGVFGRSD